MGDPRPIIGVVGSHFSFPDQSLVAGCRPAYLAAVERGGGVPMLIHLTDDAEVLDALYRRIDGILFVGGDDIDPVHYGAAPHPQLGQIEPLRDIVELALARRAAADGMPMLGICRGVQLINVALGGTLIQDIPSTMPGAADHRESVWHGAREHLAHTIDVEPNTWLARHVGAGPLAANTLHHQAVDVLAPGLRCAARAPDGVIEAIEGAGPGLIVGVQCHPEHLWGTAEPRWTALFTAFVADVRARRGQ